MILRLFLKSLDHLERTTTDLQAPEGGPKRASSIFQFPFVFFSDVHELKPCNSGGKIQFKQLRYVNLSDESEIGNRKIRLNRLEHRQSAQ